MSTVFQLVASLADEILSEFGREDIVFRVIDDGQSDTITIEASQTCIGRMPLERHKQRDREHIKSVMFQTADSLYQTKFKFYKDGEEFKNYCAVHKVMEE